MRDGEREDRKGWREKREFKKWCNYISMKINLKKGTYHGQMKAAMRLLKAKEHKRMRSKTEVRLSNI